MKKSNKLKKKKIARFYNNYLKFIELKNKFLNKYEIYANCKLTECNRSDNFWIVYSDLTGFGNYKYISICFMLDKINKKPTVRLMSNTDDVFGTECFLYLINDDVNCDFNFKIF